MQADAIAPHRRDIGNGADRGVRIGAEFVKPGAVVEEGPPMPAVMAVDDQVIVGLEACGEESDLDSVSDIIPDDAVDLAAGMR